MIQALIINGIFWFGERIGKVFVDKKYGKGAKAYLKEHFPQQNENLNRAFGGAFFFTFFGLLLLPSAFSELYYDGIFLKLFPILLLVGGILMFSKGFKEISAISDLKNFKM